MVNKVTWKINLVPVYNKCRKHKVIKIMENNSSKVVLPHKVNKSKTIYSSIHSNKNKIHNNNNTKVECPNLKVCLQNNQDH